MASASGIRAGRAFVELFADDSKLVRGLNAARKRLQAFGASARAIGTKLLTAGSLVAAPLSFAVKAGSDMEETMNKFNVVFGDNAPAVKNWSDQFAGQMGRSKKQVADFLAGTQDLLVPIGFDDASATAMSQQLTGLAIDLASFNNMTDSDVLRDLHAALTGSSEVMKKYGVIVNETAVKQEMLNQGIDPRHATEQQKVMSRLAIIMRGTTAAQGDAERSAGSFANQMKALQAKVEDAAVEIGSALLPVVTPLVTALADAVKMVSAWIKENRGLVVVLAKVAAAVVAAGLAFVLIGTVVSGFGATLGALASVLTGIGSAFSLVGSAIAALMSPIGLVIAGVGALAAYLITSTDAGGQALAWLGDKFAVLKDEALAAWQGISDALAAGDIGLAARILWLSLKLQWQKGVDALNRIWANVKNVFLTTWTEAVFSTAAIATEGWAGLQSAWTETIDFLADAWAIFTSGLTKTWNTAVGFIRTAWVKLKSLFDDDVDVDAEVSRITEETSTKNAAADQSRDERIFEREQQRRQRLSEIEQQRSGTLEELERERVAEQDRHSEQFRSDVRQSEDALTQARQEWQQAIEQAAEARRQSESETDDGPARTQSPGDLIQQLQQQLNGAGEQLQETQERISVTGTFNAAAVRGLGGGSPEERTAKATEETAKNTSRILDEARHNGLAFS